MSHPPPRGSYYHERAVYILVSTYTRGNSIDVRPSNICQGKKGNRKSFRTRHDDLKERPRKRNTHTHLRPASNTEIISHTYTSDQVPCQKMSLGQPSSLVHAIYCKAQCIMCERVRIYVYVCMCVTAK